MKWVALAGLVVGTVRLAAAQPGPPPAPVPDPVPQPTPPPGAQPDVETQPQPPPPPPQPEPRPLAPPPQPSKLDRAMAESLCAARDPSCDWIATLGGLERASVGRALAARGYEVDPVPWGKVVGAIHVYNEDVFAERNAGIANRVLRFFNNFHVTTKEHVVAAEVVIAPGEVWNQELVEESARRLRDPSFTSVIVVLPVKSAVANTVDVLVVTRDVWSLRLNTQYTYQQSKLTNLAMSLSENNLLGRRKLVAAAFTMDQGAVFTGPLYIDKNFLGEHLEMRGRVNTVLNRDALFDGDFVGEGSTSEIRLAKPLWRLSSEWGASLIFSHRYAIERRFLGTGLRPVHCPIGGECSFPRSVDIAGLPQDELLDTVYRAKRLGATASVVRQLGTKVKHQITIGHAIDSSRPRLMDTFQGTVEQRDAFARLVLPPYEIDSAPFISYALFTPRYKTRRNVQTFDLAEDLRLGPELEASYGLGLELLGSDAAFQRGGLGAGYTLAWGRDGSVRASATYGTRYQDGEFRDNSAAVATRIVTPTWRIGRIVAESSLATRWNERTPGFYTIGSENGLRAFEINEFFGARLFSTQVEARSIPTRVWVLRVGGVVFYETGDAADQLGDLQLHQDVGFGIRFLIPQTSRELLRIDAAFALDGPAANGVPRISSGFQSEF